MELETFIDQFLLQRHCFSTGRMEGKAELWPWSWSCCSIRETLMYGLQSLLPCKFMWTFARLHVRTLTPEQHKWIGAGCKGLLILTRGFSSIARNWRAFVLQMHWKHWLELVCTWVHTQGQCDLLIRAPVSLIPWPLLSIHTVHDLWRHQKIRALQALQLLLEAWPISFTEDFPSVKSVSIQYIHSLRTSQPLKSWMTPQCLRG